MKPLLPQNNKAFVFPHSGAIVEDMQDHVNPTRRHKPDLYILHAGTNDLRSGKQPVEIANEIIQVAASLQTDQNEVAVSAIVKRSDQWDEKGKRVNEYLKFKTRQINLGFIEHNNITNVHLNNGGLHLNNKGVELISSNFANFIKL